ncbi:hypothetical protein QVD17_25857 [Tagetes erecta]|uniref:Uncharacterized protein n=1 Tax=Tagetes erecta TaxID=13708 RepID=A0AAD8K916_TARER|nr:hypothetical protein QVD17_25857 [Tagetes erecta]
MEESNNRERNEEDDDGVKREMCYVWSTSSSADVCRCAQFGLKPLKTIVTKLNLTHRRCYFSVAAILRRHIHRRTLNHIAKSS